MNECVDNIENHLISSTTLHFRGMIDVDQQNKTRGKSEVVLITTDQLDVKFVTEILTVIHV